MQAKPISERLRMDAGLASDLAKVGRGLECKAKSAVARRPYAKHVGQKKC